MRAESRSNPGVHQPRGAAIEDRIMNDLVMHVEVRIHIDREDYVSRNPTTGTALYDLAGLGKHKDLYRETDGDEEDELVPNDATVVHLMQGEHFYSQKTVAIIVNGEEKETSEVRLSYVEAIVLAYGSVQEGPNYIYTIAYRKGPSQNPKGTLGKGETVLIKKGMIFDVTFTDRS
jgi:hypothetical protein